MYQNWLTQKNALVVQWIMRTNAQKTLGTLHLHHFHGAELPESTHIKKDTAIINPAVNMTQ